MTIEHQAIETLADALKEYYSSYEIDDICGNAGLSVDYRDNAPDYLKLALKLSNNAHQDHIRSFLNQTCAELVERVQAKIELAQAEDMIFHQQMRTQLQQLQVTLNQVPKVKTVSKPAGSRQFNGMLEVQSFLGTARGNLIVVDPYVDSRTLACFSRVKHRIRLMMRKDPDANLELLEAALQKYRARGINITIRRHATVRDRYISFNECCWLADTSLQKTDKIPLHFIEIKDAKKLILNEIARKWNEATPLAG